MRAAMLVLGLVVAGCGDDEGEEGAPKTAYERDLAPKLASCTGCHDPERAEAGLDLTNVRALFDQPSGQHDMPLITPGNHRQSYLWHKVAGTQGIAGGLGTRMPVGARWTDEDIDLLARWIDLGAPE